MNNLRKCSFFQVVALVITMLSGFIFPTTTLANDADAAQYEMRSWKFNIVGDSGSLNISYLGKDGINLSRGFPLSKEMYAGHETDRTWTEYDSAGPFLAYIKKNGMDSNIKDVFNVTYYDPSILKALEGQGVALSQIGGTTSPRVGPVILPVIMYQYVVGIGISKDGQTIPLPKPEPPPIPEPANVRLAGLDRFQTAKVISENFNNAQCSNVILVSGNDFPDALTASILSKKLNAPILLVNSTVNASTEALNYINAHVATSARIYIIGGTAVVSNEFEARFRQDGRNDIRRLGGHDRYDTNMLVVQEVNISQTTPVIVASGENFPDALSVASFSGSKQYPMLLMGRNYFPYSTKEFLVRTKPSVVYITGGTSVVSQDIENQIKGLLPNSTIKRLSGNDRFDTTGAVLREFALSPQTIYLANGFNFPDALSGGALAAKTGSPILLIDHSITTLPPAIEAYLKNLRDAGIHPTVMGLGGKVVVPYKLIQQAEAILNGH